MKRREIPSEWGRLTLVSAGYLVLLVGFITSVVMALGLGVAAGGAGIGIIMSGSVGFVLGSGERRSLLEAVPYSMSLADRTAALRASRSGPTAACVTSYGVPAALMGRAQLSR